MGGLVAEIGSGAVFLSFALGNIVEDGLVRYGSVWRYNPQSERKAGFITIAQPWRWELGPIMLPQFCKMDVTLVATAE